uniref:DUF4099 domain-containing protein n=1 Tax=Pedobacter sp. TaxID=1411316 RepID=UPI00159B58BE|nr:DUF4099 domain-containing protein [Pedobacter sp.]QJS06255.1 hypothetical protein [Pedobacter sp.]
MNEVNQLPIKELESYGLIKNGILQMEQSNASALKRGNVTDLLEIKDIKAADGFNIESMQAKVSIVENEVGEKRVRLDPVYKEVQKHPLLDANEHKKLLNQDVANIRKVTGISGTLVNFGKANFEFNEKGTPNYFLELTKNDGTSKHIWGVDLERALIESNYKIGDKVQLNNLGFKKVTVDVPIKDENNVIISFEKKEVNRNTWEVVESKPLVTNRLNNSDYTEKSKVIEYDPDTRQFMSYDPSKVKVPEAINNESLSSDKKRKLKDGEVIQLSDGTEVQFRSSDKNGLRSNRSALVLSILIDGGLSYLLIIGISRLLGKQSEQEKSYSKGYLQALKEVEKQLERKQQKFPNDKSLANEINIVKGEFSKASTMSASALNDLRIKDADDIKNEKSVNDPDHGKDNQMKHDEKDVDRSQGRGR